MPNNSSREGGIEKERERAEKMSFHRRQYTADLTCPVHTGTASSGISWEQL